MENLNFNVLENDDLLKVDGGGFWGDCYNTFLTTAGFAYEGAEAGSILGPEGSFAGAVGWGLCGLGWSLCTDILCDNY